MSVRGIGPSQPRGAGGPGPDEYVARKGDRLGEVAKRLGVSAGALAKANPGVKAEAPLAAGQRLTVPPRTAAEGKPAGHPGLAGFEPGRAAGGSDVRPRTNEGKAVASGASEPTLEPGQASIWGSPEAKLEAKPALDPGQAAIWGSPEAKLEAQPALEPGQASIWGSPEAKLSAAHAKPTGEVATHLRPGGVAAEMRLTADQFGFDAQGNVVIKNDEIRDLFRALSERAAREPGTASWTIRVE